VLAFYGPAWFSDVVPANLTPEFEKAELRYRQAVTDEERLEALEQMLAVIPKHKGTEKMQADLKRRLSQLRKAEQKSSHVKGTDLFHVPKTGAGQVVLVGPPNTGKSSLLAATTKAPVKIAEYPFTTTIPCPGMWQRDDVQLQLIDTPPFTEEHIPAGLFGTIRHADVVCLVAETGDGAPEQVETTLRVMGGRGLLLSPRPRQAANTAPEAIPGLILLNKADLAEQATLQAACELVREVAGEQSAAPNLDLLAGWQVLTVSAKTHLGFDTWFACLWDLLGIVRVYSKEPGKPPDMHKPFTLPLGATVADLARHIHRDLPERMRFARLWGHSRFEGQQVHRTEMLRDRDIVEIRE
jgi:uncharacterized protein